MGRLLRPLTPLLLLLGLVAACALPVRSPVSEPDHPPAASAEGGEQLWRIKILRGGETQFAGLLGTRMEDDGLYYVLLDGSGVTLLEARLSAGGEYQPIRELKIFRDHRLPGFLAQSLRRIFLLQPAAAPCDRNLLLRFCQQEASAQGMKKFAKLGPLPLWRVEYTGQPATLAVNWTGIAFTNPWLRVTLLLTRE
ncbi:MAG TPA: hypothetical protein ENN98_05970 [Desulfurivibrio alkaliphilus]|uniref:Outer-membrane lipoprotein LolB n=1 Tax=Desulfurivibrio alkaliphilus TaxID=427923 RepID=A0A7C2TK10_9BACT|nr:hypothetical protein [Desulfurivibrio alkaliphilus]